MCKQLEFCCPLCREQLKSALLTRAAFILIALSSFAFEFSDKFDFTSPVYLKKVPDPNDVHQQAHVTQALRKKSTRKRREIMDSDSSGAEIDEFQVPSS